MKNGTCWKDDLGMPIQAHGGNITCFGNKWYWYGESKAADNMVRDGQTMGRVPFVGVNLYTSKDLHCWHNEGIVLHPVPGEDNPLHPERIVERPKVMYCEKTGKYVMWFHADRPDYTLASAGCAVADRPEGPFTLLSIKLPNRRDCRDMTVFRDPADGINYLVHSGDWNKTLYFSQLTEEGTDFTGIIYAHLINQEREAPALCVHGGQYWCVTSGCTGWKANSALYATATCLQSGLLKLIGDPCEGPGARQTFHGQSTGIFAANGQLYILLDHWQPKALRNSGYSILPITFEGNRMTIRWQDEF